MPTTPVQALPYPALSDPANGPVAFQNLATALEDYKTIVRCTSSTRPAHVEGRIIYETDTDQLLVSNGSAWAFLWSWSSRPGQGGTAVIQGYPYYNSTGTTSFLRGGVAIVNCNITLTALSSPGDPIFYLPVGHRPPTGPIFGELVSSNVSIGDPIRVHIESADGAVRIQPQMASGTVLRGTLVVPV